MPTDRKKMDKLRRGYREEIAILEEKCKNGNATRDEQKELAKMKRKLGQFRIVTSSHQTLQSYEFSLTTNSLP